MKKGHTTHSSSSSSGSVHNTRVSTDSFSVTVDLERHVAEQDVSCYLKCVFLFILDYITVSAVDG